MTAQKLYGFWKSFNMKFTDISYNFSVAKVIAIMVVVTGHFYKGFWWAPVTNALFVFAFSAGFFTAKKYSHDFSKRKFWSAKIPRLIYPIIVIDVFLLLLFLGYGKNGIFTWHSILSLFGLNGFLDWFGVGNQSPFGAGLWFFTLLILFYILYPLLLAINKNQTHGIGFLIISFITTYILYYKVFFGHALWLSTFAFIFGVYAGRFNVKVSPGLSLGCFLFSYILMVYLSSAVDFKSLNYLLINISSIAIVVYLLNKKLPSLFLEKTLVLSGCLIEMYFIHTYMFITPTSFYIFNYLLSLLIIVATALMLSRLTAKIKNRICAA